jgi:PIN domain nuclease of toxin-antitoxin system
LTLYALDASAVLAYLWKESGWEDVETILLTDKALMSVVNVSEVACKAIERGFSEAEGRELVGNLGLQPVDFDLAQAWRAASLRMSTKALGLSLGDRACLALAESQAAVAVTADRAWLGLQIGITIKSIR